MVLEGGAPDRHRQQARDILKCVNQVILGKEILVERVLTALLAGGHILLEDVPGVGKTTLAVAFSRAMGFAWKRVQFTPDVMPSDLTGFSVYQREKEQFVYQPGAVFCNLLLADELNRTSPKTQSALLEVMAERQVSVEGKTRRLPRPFHVIATENPFGAAGTQPLPAAQTDRFMVSLSMGYPDFESERRLIDRPRFRQEFPGPFADTEAFLEMQRQVEHVYIHEDIQRYIVSLVSETRGHELLELGASPRATMDLAAMARAAAWLAGRDYVTPAEVRELYKDVLSHRLMVNGKGRQQRIGKEEILEEIADRVEAPTWEKKGGGRLLDRFGGR